MKQVKRKGSNGHLGPMRRVAKAQKAEGSIGGYRIHFTVATSAYGLEVNDCLQSGAK